MMYFLFEILFLLAIRSHSSESMESLTEWKVMDPTLEFIFQSRSVDLEDIGHESFCLESQNIFCGSLIEKVLRSLLRKYCLYESSSIFTCLRRIGSARGP